MPMNTHFQDQTKFAKKKQVRWALLLGLCIAFIAIAIYAILSRVVYNPDPFIYAQAIKQLLAGEILYSGAWQDRPPLGLLFYAIPQIISSRSYLGMEVFLAFWLIIQGLLFVWVGRKNPWIALGTFSFVILFPITNWDFFWPSTEHAANMFVAILLLLAYIVVCDNNCSWKISVLVGTATTMAFHIRQSALLFCLVPLIVLTIVQSTWRARVTTILIVVSAGLASWGLLLACIVPFTDMAGYWHITFRYPFLFAQQDMGQTRWQLLKLILFTPLSAFILVFLALAVRGRYRILAIVATTVGLTASLASPRTHTHYWVQMLPVVALLIMLAFEENYFFDNLGQTVRISIITCLSLLVTLTIGVASNNLALAVQEPNGLRLRAIADSVNNLSLPDDTIFVSTRLLMPSDYIQFAVNVPPAHRYNCCWQFRHPRATLLPTSLDLIFSEYLESPPSLMLISQEYLDIINKSSRQLFEDILLVKKLMTKYSYIRIADIDEYVLLRRIDTKN